MCVGAGRSSCARRAHGPMKKRTAFDSAEPDGAGGSRYQYCANTDRPTVKFESTRDWMSALKSYANAPEQSRPTAEPPEVCGVVRLIGGCTHNAPAPNGI